MSLSKQLAKELTVAAAEDSPRQPKCSRCRHHGILVPLRGHMKFCPFLKCDCWKCHLITQRTQITARQRKQKTAQNHPQKKEQPPRDHTAVSGVKPAAEGTYSGSNPNGDTRPSSTSEMVSAPFNGVRQRAATTASSHPDLWSRPAAGEENVAGLGSEKVLPFTSNEKGPCTVTPLSVPYFDKFGQTAPLPVILLPFGMPHHYPSSFAPCPNLLLTMPRLPPVPAGPSSDGLYEPMMIPYSQSHAVYCPPPPEPGPPAVFFTLQPPRLPELFQEALMSTQHPQPSMSKHNEQDREELDKAH